MSIKKTFQSLSIISTMRLALSTGAILLATLVVPATPSFAAEQIMAVGIDRKFTYSEETNKYVALETGRDEVMFYSLAEPGNPRLIGSLPVENSIIGPPTNIAITPDQKLVLIANAIGTVPEASSASGWKMVGSNFVTVVDLAAKPIRVVGTVEVGKKPSGVAIDATGKFALVANRGSNSVSVLSIDGTTVKVTDTIDMGDTVTGVAITPDGKRAYAVKFAAHKVAELTIDASGKVTYSGRDIPVGLYPWAITIAADGSRAIVTNIGAGAASDGNAKTVSVIDLTATPVARVVQHVSVGDAPEGVAISPDGNLAAVTLLGGSFAVPKDAWFRRDVGQLTVLRRGEKGFSTASTIKVGSFPEGIAFSKDNSHLYVGNFASSTLSVIALKPDGSITSVREIKLPGRPGSLRVSGQ